MSSIRRWTAAALAVGLGSALLVTHASSGAGADPTPGAWGWGTTPYNAYGQVGRGTLDGSSVPVGVTGLPVGSDVREVAAGGQHSLALLGDGTVLAWGNSYYGALGDGSTANVGHGVPTVVTGLGAGSGVTTIAAGGAHGLAVRSDGTVVAWGQNDRGQVGDGTTVNRSTPVAVAGLTDVVAVTGGMSVSLALKSDGSVWGWGDNSSGQVTGVAGPDVLTPTPVPGLGAGSGVVQIDAAFTMAVARTADGHVLSWGADTLTAPGTLEVRTPHAIAGFDAVPAVDVSVGVGYGMAALHDGSLVAWGEGSLGRRCDGGGPWHAGASPTDLGAGSGVVDVEAAWQSTIVRFADGRLAGCGYDGNNELGTGLGGIRPDNTAVVAYHPVAVNGFGPGSGVTALAHGFAHTIAIATNPTPSEPPSTTTSGGTTVTTVPTVPTDTASIGDAVVEEGDSGARTANVTITLEHPLATKTVLTVSATSTDANLSDYQPFGTKAVAVPAGASSAKVPITYFGDGGADGTKHIALKLTGNSAVAVGDPSGTVTIVDDDAPTAATPEVSISDGRAYEGDGTVTNLVFTVALSQASSAPVTVRLTTAGWTATSGTDFTAKNVLITFKAGVRFKLVTIPIRDDLTPEDAEVFLAGLSNATGATISDAAGVGTIANDD